LHQSNPPSTDAPAEELKNKEAGEQATLVYHTLRSGQTISSNGHVVILGDINPGAKVTAGGNVLTMGKCAGTVHAGCLGNTKAVIIARSFLPATIGIAGIIAPTFQGVNKKGLLLVARINEHKMVTVEDFTMKL
jgi:septum site-determining protein MinC